MRGETEVADVVLDQPLSWSGEAIGRTPAKVVVVAPAAMVRRERSCRHARRGAVNPYSLAGVVGNTGRPVMP